ncbi:hypothetical protein C8J57DRAFT_1520572 [Mycena rebaudengoi]|nr:hypothetical protein C8J57DRAFT_1520572 [Mycena rebaudengoi]
MSPLSHLRKGLAVLKECEREKNGGDNDEEGDPKPSRKEALQAVSTLHQYIADLDEPFVRNLEGVLVTFGRETRQEEFREMVNSFITDYLAATTEFVQATCSVIKRSHDNMDVSDVPANQFQRKTASTPTPPYPNYLARHLLSRNRDDVNMQRGEMKPRTHGHIESLSFPESSTPEEREAAVLRDLERLSHERSPAPCSKDHVLAFYSDHDYLKQHQLALLKLLPTVTWRTVGCNNALSDRRAA